MRKITVTLSKAIYCGVKILDISNVHMYQFLYEKIKPRYGQDATLLYVDTDAFILEIKTNNIYADMKDELKMYDTSDYPKNHPCYSDKRKKKIGKLKDELNGVPVIRFCGVRSKMYAVEYCNVTGKLDYEPCELREEEEITKILNENGISKEEIEQVKMKDEIRLTPD